MTRSLVEVNLYKYMEKRIQKLLNKR